MLLLDALKDTTHEPILAQIERTGAERNVIAHILHNPESIYDVSLKLRESDFSNLINRIVYSHMSILMNKGVAIGQSTLVAMLRKQDRFSPEEVDSYLEIISKTNVLHMDLNYNVEMIRRASVKRQTYSEGLELLRECADDDYTKDVNDFLGRQQQRFINLSLEMDSADGVINMADIVDEVLEEVTAHPSEVPGLSTGMPELDKKIGGLQNGELIVVCARPKVGKSMMLMGWASEVSLEAEQVKPILYIDTEMDKKLVLARSLSRISGVPQKEISRGTFSDDEEKIERVKIARDMVKNGYFHYVHLKNYTIEQVVSLAWKYKIKYDISALFFDYIKLSSNMTEKNIQRDIMLGRITTTLKDLAGDLDIPIVTAAQLNRDQVIRGSDEILMYASHVLSLREFTEAEQLIQPSESKRVLTMDYSRHTDADYCAWLDFDMQSCRFREERLVPK